MFKELAREVLPPAAWRMAQKARSLLRSRPLRQKVDGSPSADPERQKLDVYWTKEMADVLESWGAGNAWQEVELMLADRSGPILDVACGTGSVMELLLRRDLDVHGIDVSDMLIDRATKRGISPERLTIGDATHMPYPDGAFAHAYSVGSLEHFTTEGIVACLAEVNRVSKGTTFHQVPTSRSNRNEGWITTVQSYHNNSAEWWLQVVRDVYPRAVAVGSSWSDTISVGTWLVCRI